MFLGDDIMNVPFKRGNILLPKNADMSKWSVVNFTRNIS